MRVTGFNHVTINVTSLERSLLFYNGILGMTVRHRGHTDAYLEWGGAWICLIEQRKEENGSGRGTPGAGVDHVAFSIGAEDFDEAVHTLKEHRVVIVREPVQRGSGRSVNFLDPDGVQLELHTSNLEERMKVWK